MAGVMQVEHETTNSIKRTTKEGRQLTYELVVLQQPERARACGSGAKSSADRRPVDPPPVVQLRILEGEEKKDVTYSYNANFFLFTTLEPARPINQPRVQPTPQPMPVLTGMPVAGMAYLDRPDPAGYFIFPDLSVRHEGKYRLNFNLYEEVKEPRDEDATPQTATAAGDKPLAGPMTPQAHVHFRLEVRSHPFAVYSAKKFPGLAESTYISRVVAEQGCRVRIRRDVRMRRRDAKPGKGYDDYDEEAGYARSERYVTPDVYNKSQAPDRPRSVSNGSVHGSVHSVQGGTPFATESRRLSQQDLGYFPQANYQQHPPPPAPVQPTHQSNTTSHLNFGGSTANQYQVPSLHPTTPSAVPAPPSYSYMQNNSNYTYQPPPAPSRAVPPSHNYPYNQSIPQPQSHYSQTSLYAENSHDYQADPRRASMPVNTQQTYHVQPLNSYGHVDHRPHSMQPYYAPPAQHPAPRPMTPHGNGQSLPPLSTIQYEKKYEPSTPVTANPTSAVSSTNSIPNYDPSSMATKYNNSSYSLNNNIQPPIPLSTANTTITVDPSRSGGTSKRSFGAVFDSSHLDRPMHSGMRPRATDQGREVPQVEAEDGSLEAEYDIDVTKMLTYKRADGTTHMKKCVSPRSY
ncbi:MAG: hypothetical protein L6R36_004062 [Xanthoria steineri]|nr:MAG: hypothetical protein L6R36_004062 [Xanthoria steineri]